MSEVPKRRRPAFDPAPFIPLFRMFGFLRAASPESLRTLFFEKAFPHQCDRTTDRMMATLVREGLLARARLPQTRAVFHLTRRSVALVEDQGIQVPDTLRHPPTPEVGGYLWLLSMMRAALVREGFRVGRGPRELYALRRFLLDDPALPGAVAKAIRGDSALLARLRPVCEGCAFRGAVGADVGSCPRCQRAMNKLVVLAGLFQCITCGERAEEPGKHQGAKGPCGGLMREVACLPVDVAWRKVDGRYDVRLLFVANPGRGLGGQLLELPVRLVGAPKVPVILRSTDPDSRFDRRAHLGALQNRPAGALENQPTA